LSQIAREGAIGFARFPRPPHDEAVHGAIPTFEEPWIGTAVPDVRFQ
jgi:hypothetical protein